MTSRIIQPSVLTFPSDWYHQIPLDNWETRWSAGRVNILRGMGQMDRRLTPRTRKCPSCGRPVRIDLPWAYCRPCDITCLLEAMMIEDRHGSPK